MIDLSLPCELSAPDAAPFVVKLSEPWKGVHDELSERFFARPVLNQYNEYDTVFGRLSMAPGIAASLHGDVVFIDPAQRKLHRWIRRGDGQNTLLVTEQCDQLCIMCSQPPRKTHTDLFSHLTAACLLSDPGADIGISGGEPTLYKRQLFELIRTVGEKRPDLSFHVLTNAQHFEECDIPELHQLRNNICWGVPLYSHVPLTHDQIVSKPGAFESLRRSLGILVRAGAVTELRTVVLQQNVQDLPGLARWVIERLPGLDCWAIMQLELQGFARRRWADQFHDHSVDFQPIAEATSLAAAHKVPVALYNFPRCTVPIAFRDYAPPTISDWKRTYPEDCNQCAQKPLCGGLFAWHNGLAPYRNWGAV